MNRLTESDWKESCEVKYFQPRFVKLAEYEDTGLEPCQVAQAEREIRRLEEKFNAVNEINLQLNLEIASLKDQLETETLYHEFYQETSFAILKSLRSKIEVVRKQERDKVKQ